MTMSKRTSKIAVYRDEDGILHRVSAACSHLGCVVRWNSLERSWDYPCHGSRFGVDGKVLNGPAIKGTARVTALADLLKAQCTSAADEREGCMPKAPTARGHRAVVSGGAGSRILPYACRWR